MTATAPRILIIEDETGIADFLDMGLREEGFDVHHAADGLDGLRAFDEVAPALVILDLMLPGIDGMEVCRKIRSRNSTPVIMLTARRDLESRIDGFQSGADDYIPKPFSFEELLARVRAVLRRSGQEVPGDELSFEDIRISMAAHEVTRGGQRIELTAREFDVLALFVRHPRQALTKRAILERVWGPNFYGDENIVEVYVRRLRRKLGDTMLISTLRGVGYRLRDPRDPSANA